MPKLELQLNKAEPLIMHIDLNSCFAIIEQQANRLTRGKPVGVAAYSTPRGMILASSYEAKRLGIKLGTRVGEARAICPDIYITMPDPEKYREAHRRFKKVLMDYTDDVTPKSIDEFAIDFSTSPLIRKRSLVDIGYEIKQRIKEEVGEAVTCNVGIGTNRWWAKTAAGLHKPDGLDVIDHTNVREALAQLDLMDLCGINRRFKARLQLASIFNPLEFMDADRVFLEKQVFQSILGYYWYVRLRGWEVDGERFKRKSFGHQYALSQKTDNKKDLEVLLMKLCEKAGRRMRKAAMCGQGIGLWLRMEEGRGCNRHHRLPHRIYSGIEIFAAARRLLYEAEIPARVTLMSMAVTDLSPVEPEQLELLEAYRQLGGRRKLSDALDAINDKWGEFTITPATMMDMDGKILDRIAFENVSEI